MTTTAVTASTIISKGVHDGNSAIFSEDKGNSDGSKDVEIGLVRGD